MNPQQIQIEVAKLMGWTFHSSKDILDSWSGLPKAGPEYWVSPSLSVFYGDFPISDCPDYTEYLDACHEFEKDEDDEYWEMLFMVTAKYSLHVDEDALNAILYTCKATPLQRCEAKLRRHGKWVE